MTCWWAGNLWNEVSGGVSIDCQSEFSWDIRCLNRHQWLLQKHRLLCDMWCLGYSQQFTGFSSINPRQADRQALSHHILLVLHCSHGTGVKCQNWCFHKKQDQEWKRHVKESLDGTMCLWKSLYLPFDEVLQMTLRDRYYIWSTYYIPGMWMNSLNTLFHSIVSLRSIYLEWPYILVYVG